jgi:hypothetical protein
VAAGDELDRRVEEWTVHYSPEQVQRSGRAKLDSLVGDTASGRTPRRSTKNAKKTTTQPLASL